MLLTNGRIHLMDAALSIVDTVVVREGRVAFAGRRADISAGVGEALIDVRGRAVFPGFVDAHAHLTSLAKGRLELRVAHVASEDDAVAVVAKAAGTVAPAEWLTGRGWDQTLWPGRHFPTRVSLDRALPMHPVALTRIDGHAIWANSAALRAARIDRHTGDPAGGRVVKDEHGDPTGLLIDTAQELIRAVIPLPSAERFERAIEDAVAECLAKGLTGIHEMGSTSRLLRRVEPSWSAASFPSVTTSP